MRGGKISTNQNKAQNQPALDGGTLKFVPKALLTPNRMNVYSVDFYHKLTCNILKPAQDY